MITSTLNCKREFVPRDQVSSLLVVYCSLFLHLNLVVSRNFLAMTIVMSWFFLLIFYFEKFLTFAVYVKLLNSLTSNLFSI